jgi:hypothetical protein
VGAKCLSQRGHSKLERPKYIPNMREEDPGFFKGETVDVVGEACRKDHKSAVTPMGASNKR